MPRRNFEGENLEPESEQEESVPKVPQEKGDTWSPAEYVKRTAFKDESAAREIIDESLTRLSVPLKEVTYQDADTIEVNTNELKFKFSYLPIVDEEKPGVEKYVRDKTTGLEGKPYESFITNPSNWRKLEKLTFTIEDNEKDIFTSLPENSKIFFCPTIEDYHGAAHTTHNELTNESEYRIYIIGDITCPRAVATLLHEMGHVFDERDKRSGKKYPIKGGYADWHYPTAQKIMSERNASAFAFKMMKPFLKDKQIKQDMINYLKGYALSSYNWEAQQQFEKDETSRPYREREGAKAMADWEAEQEELRDFNLWEDFEEWKKTDTYKTWKKKEENKELDEYEEFGAWKQWLEDTGYDYKKDLENKK